MAFSSVSTVGRKNKVRQHFATFRARHMGLFACHVGGMSTHCFFCGVVYYLVFLFLSVPSCQHVFYACSAAMLGEGGVYFIRCPFRGFFWVVG